MIKKKNTLRYVLLLVGAILIVSGNIALETGNSKGEVATIVVGVIALIGCYMWTRDKNRASGFALWALLAPVGYLAIMTLKDKSAQ